MPQKEQNIVQEHQHQVAHYRAWIEKAIALGDAMLEATPEKRKQLLDERHRITQRTQETLNHIKNLEEQIHKTHPQVHKKIWLERKKNLSDLAPRILQQERKLHKLTLAKQREIHQNMAQYNVNTSAIRSYLKAPGSRPSI